MPKGRRYDASKPVTKTNRVPAGAAKSEKGALTRLKDLAQQRDRLNEQLLKEQCDSIVELIRSKTEDAKSPEQVSRLNDQLLQIIQLLVETT